MGYDDERINGYREEAQKKLRKSENVQGTLTRMPTLMTAYKYAKLRAIGSFDALKRATASVPIKTDMLRYETQAIVQH